MSDHIEILNGGRLVQAGTLGNYYESSRGICKVTETLRAKTVVKQMNLIVLLMIYKVDEESYIEQFCQ